MGILDEITSSQNSALAAPGAFGDAQQFVNQNINQQNIKAQTASQQNDLQSKQRQMQLSMLSGVLNEPDPEKQRQILSNIVPIANKINPSYQIDPSIDIPTVRALVQSTRPAENLPPSGLDLSSLPPAIRAGIQSGQISMKDLLSAQATNPFLNVGGSNGQPALPAADATGAMPPAQPSAAGTGRANVPTPIYQAPPDVTARISQLPASMQPTIQAIVEGRELPPSLNSRSPGAQSIMQAVNYADPSFDYSNAQNRAKTRASFTSGNDANNITAINTAIPHLIALKQAYDNLGNSTFTPYNWVKNTAGNVTGIGDTQAKTAAVNTDAAAVSHELAKVFRSTGMSEGEIKDWQTKISENASPAASDQVIQSALDLMDGRLQALGDKYSQGMGVAKNGIELLSPSSQAAYAKLRAGEQIPPAGAAGQLPAQMQPPKGNAASQLPAAMQPKQAAQGPQPGQIEGGYVFMGGDPSKPESWKAAK